MHAAIEYGLWLHNIYKKNATPELFVLIDNLSKEDYRGLKVPRAVLGRFFPWLNLMSPEWAQQNKDTLFPEDDLAKFSPGWIAYICHCKPFMDIFPILESKYRHSLSKQGIIGGERNYYDSRLTQHIATFYLRGLIPIESELMELALSQKSEKEIFDVIGRWLNGDVLDGTVERAVNLWDFYFDTRIKNKTPTLEQKKVLSGFSRWVESPLLDMRWKLDHLQELIKLEVPLSDVRGMCEGLAEASNENIEQVLTIFRDLISNNIIDHFVLLHRKELHTVLEKGCRNESGSIQKLTDKIVNMLGEKGYSGYDIYLQGKRNKMSE